MSTPTLDAYRRLQPEDTDPDTIVVPRLIQQFSDAGVGDQIPDLLTYANQLQSDERRNNPPNLVKEFTQSTVGGIDQAKAAFYSLAAQGADAVGSEHLKDWGLQKYQQSVASAAEHAPTIGSVQDVHGVSDAVRYGVGLVGSQAPMVAGTIAATGAGALAGSVLGPEGTLAGGVEGATEALAAAQAVGNASKIFKAYQTLQGAVNVAGSGARVGGTLATFGAGYAQSQNYAQLALSGADDPLLTSAAIGTAGGLLMSVIPSKVLRGAFGAEAPAVQQATLEQFLQRGEKQIPGLSGYIALHGAEHGANGAMLMMGQELVNMAGDQYAHRNDPSYQITDSEIADKLINGAVSGALMGATFGAAGAPGERQAAVRERGFAQGLKLLYEAGIKRDAMRDMQTPGPLPAVPPPAPPADTGLQPGSPPSTNAEMPFDIQTGVSYENGTPGVPEPVRAEAPTQPPVVDYRGRFRPDVQALVDKYGEPTPPPPMYGRGQEPVHATDSNAVPGLGMTLSDSIWGGKGQSPYPEERTVEWQSDKPSAADLAGDGRIVGGAPATNEAAPVDYTAKPQLPEPQLRQRDVQMEKLPPLRAEVTWIPPGATQDTIMNLGQKGIRYDENRKKTTKKYFAVRDNEDGTVKMFPIYKSTGNELRLDNGIQPKISDAADLANYLNEPIAQIKRELKQPNARGDSLKAILGALQKGSFDDTFVKDFLSEKTEAGDAKYSPIGFVDSAVTTGGKHFVFTDERAFKRAIGEAEMPGAITSKGNKLGSQGVDPVLEKVNKLNPAEGHAVTLLASFLDSVPHLQAKLSGLASEDIHLNKREARAESNTASIMKGLLRVPDARTFQETIDKAQNPASLYRIRRGRLFGLFSPTDWETFKTLTANPKVEPQELLTFLDKMVSESGWSSRQEFLNKVTAHEGESQLGGGLELVENKASVAENEGLTGLAEDNAGASHVDDRGREAIPASEEHDIVSIQGGATDDGNLHDVDAAPELKIPEKAEGVAGLTGMEAGALAGIFKEDGGRKMFDREVKNIKEARAEGEISTPKEDFEFQAIKSDLATILRTMFAATRKVMPKLTDDFLYGVYSNLDRVQRDSRPERATYRETPDNVSRKFQATTNVLAGMGVDVNLIEPSVNQASDFLVKNWGRLITQEDGRRMIVMGVDDVTKPSSQNLQTMYHEVAHHLFAEEPVWMQRLIHEAVERLSDVQSKVFSRTWDQRIKLGNPEGLSATEFTEEILAEHLAHFGVDQTQARTLGQRFVDALTKVWAQAVAVFSQLRGQNISPELTQKYVEIRMKDFLDRVYNSEHDLETLAGVVRETADYQATLYKRVGGELGEYGYDPDSGNMFLKGVLDDSVMASRFNLDNTLQFHDAVVRNSEADKLSPEEIKRRTFGVTTKPQSLTTVLNNISQREVGGNNSARIKAGVDLLMKSSTLLHSTDIRVASTLEDFANLEYGGASLGADAIYSISDHEIVINPKAWERGKLNDLGLAYLIAHESVHAATSRAIDFYLSYKDTFGKDLEALLVQRGVDNLTPEASAKLREDAPNIIASVDRLQRIYKWLSTDVKLKRLYGMDTLHEFAAEMLTEKNFQEELINKTLPTHLQFYKTPSVFRQILHVVASMLGMDIKNPSENALGASLEVLNDVITSSNIVSVDGTFGKRLFLPTTEAESDRLVKNDYESHLARLNTQSDFYKSVLKPFADSAKLDLDKYISKVLGIFNPDRSINDVREKLAGQTRQLNVNQDLRLTDVAGEANKIKASQDRGQVIKSLDATVTNAIHKMAGKIAELNEQVPEMTRELERQKERLVRFETMLHDVSAVRDNAVKTFKASLNTVKRGTDRMLEWSARHDGLAGVAKELFRVKPDEELPQDYGELIEDSVAENSSNFLFSDILTSFVKHDVNYDTLTPKEIEKEVQRLAKETKDPSMVELADGSPKARADLALTIYYAKTNPVDMAAMEIRIEKDPERKDQILRRIQKIIRGQAEVVGDMNDLFRDSRKGDVKVGKAQRALTDAERKLTQTSKALDAANTRIAEMNKASVALEKALMPWHAELGIRGDAFSATDGSKILRTPNLTGPVGREILKLGKDSDATVAKILMENIDWLKVNAHNKDEYWHAVNDQVEGLKKVAGDFTFEKFRNSFYLQTLNSLPDRMVGLGHPLAKLAANRVHRWLSKTRSQERLLADGYATGKAVTDAMKAVGFANGYDGFRDIFWNPANHFRQHLKLLPHGDAESNAAYSKEKTFQFFQRNEYTRDILKKNPGGFEALWTALEKNAETSKKIANLASEWKTFVEDEDIRIVDPRTGRETFAKRPALDVGYGTTQRSLMNKGIWMKRMLEDIKGPENNSLWAEWSQTDHMADPAVLFSPDVIRDFVRPYIYDASTLHLNGPALPDGETKARANPMHVQSAFEASNGNMIDFASRLFDLEDTTREETPEMQGERKKVFIKDTLDFFKGQYTKLFNLTKRQEMFNKEGIDMLSSPMMDNRKMDDLPPEFLDYYIYDKSTVHGMVNNLAAHSELGRDLGHFDKFDANENKGVLWELHTTARDLELQRGDYKRLVENTLRENPRASSKEIDTLIEAKVGKPEFTRLKELLRAEMETKRIAEDLKVFFTRPNGVTRELNIAQRVIGLTTAAMTSSLKTAILSSYQVFEPFNKYGMGKVGAVQVGRNIDAFLRSGAGAVVQGLTGQAKMASTMARFMNAQGLGLDNANEITTGQIIADPGKNNVYADQRLLGWLTKMRGIVFDSGIKGNEGERIAPALRIQAPAVTLFHSLNQAGIEAELQLYNNTFKSALATMESNPSYMTDPNFKFTPEHLNLTDKIFDKLSFDEMNHELKIMGTTMEIEVRALAAARAEGKDLGDTLLSPDMARLIASRAMDSLSLHSSLGTVPIWAFNSKVGQLAMPLLRWPLAKMNQLVGSIRENNGQISQRMMIAGASMLLLGAIPSAIAISMLLDQYDEHALGKKSNLVGFNWDSPGQTATALTERLARVGTFGLLGDVVNGIRVYGTDGDLRGISLDQRIVFANSILSVIGLANTAINQKGTLTYDTFYRPLINLMGGTGILQGQEIINQMTNSVMGVPIFTKEAQSTARINAINYLRGAGRVLNLNVRNSNGMASLPNPEKPWVNQMVVAAYTNDRSTFIDAYNLAVEAAKDEGRPDPVDHVKRAFQSYHPLRYVFQTPPSQAEVSQIFTTLSDKGKEDVQSALYYFNAYSASLGLKPYSGKENVATGSAKAAPSAFAPLSL